jgi:predicted lipid carrier protein YhbT
MGEWLVRFNGDDVTVTREHGKGDVAVRGPVEDLFLWLWGRIPADRLEVFGDRSLLERYRQLVPQ